MGSYILGKEPKTGFCLGSESRPHAGSAAQAPVAVFVKWRRVNELIWVRCLAQRLAPRKCV